MGVTKELKTNVIYRCDVFCRQLKTIFISVTAPYSNSLSLLPALLFCLSFGKRTAPVCTTSRLCCGCLECSTNWLPSSPPTVQRCQKHYVQLGSSLPPLPLTHHRTLTVAKAMYIVHKIINGTCQNIS